MCRAKPLCVGLGKGLRSEGFQRRILRAYNAQKGRYKSVDIDVDDYERIVFIARFPKESLIPFVKIFSSQFSNIGGALGE